MWKWVPWCIILKVISFCTQQGPCWQLGQEKWLDYLIVLSEPLSFQRQLPTIESVDLDLALQLECAVDGKPAPHVTWRKDGHPLDDLWVDNKEGLVQKPHAGVTDAGSYECVADNGFETIHQITLVKVKSWVALTFMLWVSNFACTEWCKRAEKWLKPWHMGTDLRVLSESYPMNTNMTGFNLCVLVLWTKVDSTLEGLTLSYAVFHGRGVVLICIILMKITWK